MSATSEHRRSKLLVLVSLTLVLAAVWVVMRTPPADGYEISIYDAYPTYFWAFVVGAILVGQVVILRGARRRIHDPYWRVAFAVILIVDVMLLLLPEFRGYPLYGRADVLTHIGFAKNIAANGTLPSSNIYPSIHLLLLSFSYATGMDLISVVGLVPLAFTPLCIVSSYLLLRRTFDDTRVILFGLAFVSFLTYQTAHVNASPYAQSALLVPFVLYLAVTERQARTLRTKVPLVVLLVATVTYHPLTSLFLLGIFVVALLTKRVAVTVGADELAVGAGVRDFVSTNATAIVFVAFLVWYHHFAGVIFQFQSVFMTLTGAGVGASTLQSYSSTIQETTPQLIDLVRIGLFKYGFDAFVIALAAQYGAVVLYRVWRRDADYDHYQLVFIVSCGLFTAFASVMLVNDLIVGFTRPLTFAKMFALFLLGPLFVFLFDRIDHGALRVGLRGLLYGALVVVVVLSVFTVYFSPLASQSSHQVSEMDLQGARWMLEHQSGSRNIEEFSFGQTRFADAFYGQQGSWPELRAKETAPPPHFNYTEHETLGQSYGNDTYLVLTEKGRTVYPAKFPDYRKFWEFTPADFARVERDVSVNQVYTNGEFDVYLVNGTKTGSPANATRVTDQRRLVGPR